jgi:hypothetical protein
MVPTGAPSLRIACRRLTVAALTHEYVVCCVLRLGRGVYHKPAIVSKLLEPPGNIRLLLVSDRA